MPKDSFRMQDMHANQIIILQIIISGNCLLLKVKKNYAKRKLTKYVIIIIVHQSKKSLKQKRISKCEISLSHPKYRELTRGVTMIWDFKGPHVGQELCGFNRGRSQVVKSRVKSLATLCVMELDR